MVRLLPDNVVVLRLVGSSPQNWDDYMRAALGALQEFGGQLKSASIVAAATDSPGRFRAAAEALPTVREHLRCVGYRE